MKFRSTLFLLLSLNMIWGLFSCSQPETKTAEAEAPTIEKDTYVAVIDTNMTMAELAKANKIGEPYLRSMLGMPNIAGKNMAIYQLRKNYKFSYDDVKRIIEDAKNRR